MVQPKKTRMLCDINDIVWFVANDYCPMQQVNMHFVQSEKITRIILAEDIIEYRTASRMFRQEAIGKDIFLTREEAQARLEITGTSSKCIRGI